MPVYGLAENSVGLAFPPLGRGPLIDRIDRGALMKSGAANPATDGSGRDVPACGRPLPGHQIRIVGDSGHELPDRREGRVQFTGPSATAGYFRHAEATAALFDGDWLDSGDLGYMASGELYVTGRQKDLIIKAGRNIFPAELEAAVGDLDGIQKGNVAVFGSPDPATGTERMVVMAECRRRDPAAQDRLRQAINGLATDLVGTPPDQVMLVPPRHVPKTSSGKIRRQAARALFEAGIAGQSVASVRWQIVRLTWSGIGPLCRRLGRAGGAWAYAIYAWAVLILIAPLAWLAVAAVPAESWCWGATRLLLGPVAACHRDRNYGQWRRTSGRGRQRHFGGQSFELYRWRGADCRPAGPVQLCRQIGTGRQSV